MTPREGDPLLSHTSSTTTHKNRGSFYGPGTSGDARTDRGTFLSRTAKRMVILAILLGGLAMILGAVFLPHLFTHHAPDASGPAREWEAAYQDASYDGTDFHVQYSTNTTTNNNNNNNNIIISSSSTFADLAKVMLPPWYDASVLALHHVLLQQSKPDNRTTSTSTTEVTSTQVPLVLDPSKVKQARKVFLTTRDLLDVFSPVYASHSSWVTIRQLYKVGYEVVGDFQDLDHAHVEYTTDDPIFEERHRAVMDWTEHFLALQSRQSLRTFLVDKVHDQGCFDHAQSHLFWGDDTVDMDTSSNADPVVVQAPLPCGGDSATTSLNTLALLQLTKAQKYWTEIQTYESILQVEHHESYHNLRKEIRSLLDEYQLFDFVMFPAQSSEADKSRVQDAIQVMGEAFHTLGVLNDDWTAFSIYNATMTNTDSSSSSASSTKRTSNKPSKHKRKHGRRLKAKQKDPYKAGHDHEDDDDDHISSSISDSIIKYGTRQQMDDLEIKIKQEWEEFKTWAFATATLSSLADPKKGRLTMAFETLSQQLKLQMNGNH